MALLGGLLNLDELLGGVLGNGEPTGASSGDTGGSTSGEGEGSGGLLTPVISLIGNLIDIGEDDDDSQLLGDLLDLDLLNEKAVVKLTLLGEDLVVLPDNGGVLDADLLGEDGLVAGVTDTVTNIIQLDGLLGDAGLINLTGVLGEGGILDLGGVLGGVLDLLSPDGSLDPDEVLDPDGEIDPDLFEHQLIGTNGPDHFVVPDGSTYIHGHGAHDTVRFTQSSQGMSFAVGNDAVVFAKDDKLFFFEHVERVVFSEGTLHLDTGVGEIAGMAYRLYQAAFDRTPDADGLEYWIGRLDSGNVSLKAVADSFIESPEYVRTYGTKETVSDSEFVELLYVHTLGRDYDREGHSYWVDRLENNQTNRADLLAFFSESEENQTRVAEQIDNGIWIA